MTNVSGGGTTPQNAVNAAASVIQLKDIAELRATEPASPGEFASVLEYTRGTRMGGGVFVYDATDKDTVDDGGLNFVTPGKKRWKRVVTDYNSVTVVDFGAVADGKTDCIDAVKRMFTWSQNKLPSAGIRFTAGEFSMSMFEYSAKEINRFKVTGASVNFGYFPTTTLYFNWETKPRGEFFFNVNARYVEISGLVIKGKSFQPGGTMWGDGDGGTALNKVGFFSNVIVGGQFLRVSSMEFRYLGGCALQLIDTLDCKIDQFYARGCQGSIVKASWSGREEGVWDHSTAIELSNFNIQWNYTSPVFDLPRCTQSFIRNGWIEHSDDAGDLTNGQWVIEGLAIESTDKPLRLGYCRALILQKSIHQKSAGFDYSTEGIDPWELLSEGDRGLMELSDWGAIIQGSLSYDFVTSQHHMDNQTSENKWFYIGEFNFSASTVQIHVSIIGTAQYLSQPETQTGYSNRTPEGVAHIYLQAKDGVDSIASWHGEGSCPVLEVHVSGIGSRTKLYVKIAAFTGFATALVETNGKDRYQSGNCFIFRKSFTACDGNESAALDTAIADKNTRVAFEQHWVGNDKVGFGYNDNKELLLTGPYFFKDVQVGDKWIRRHFMKVRVNKVERSIELLSATDPTGQGTQ